MGRIQKTVPGKADPPEVDAKIQVERQRIAKHLVRELRKAGYGCSFEDHSVAGSLSVMKSVIVKRSVLIDGHKTSVSLEEPFWTDLKKIAHVQQITLSGLVAEIDSRREQGNLSSAIRLFVLRHVRNAAKGTDVARPYIPYDPVREARSR